VLPLPIKMLSVGHVGNNYVCGTDWGWMPT
jgi:hypothetical protein